MRRAAALLSLAGAWAGANAAEPAPDSTDEMLATTRATVRSTAEWLARGVDSWFGSKPFEQGGKVSNGRLELGLLKRQHESADYRLRFNARFRLPNLEERAGYVFFGRDNRREVIADTPQPFTRQQQLQRETDEDQSFFAGIGLALFDEVDFRIGLRSGIKPYVQGRYEHSWPLGERRRLDFRETVFWSAADRLGSSTALSYEIALSSTRALRWLNAATITQESRHFDWSSSFGWFETYGPQRVLSLEALISGTEGSGVGVSDYGLQAKWRQPVHKDWLIGELIVGRFWPKPDPQTERRGAWAIGGTLRLLF